MPRPASQQRTQDMYWFAHGGVDTTDHAAAKESAQVSADGGGEDEPCEGGSLKSCQEKTEDSLSASANAASTEDPLTKANGSTKRLAVEERKRQMQEAEQEKNDAILKKHAEREAAFEARRNAQRNNVSFAFGIGRPPKTEFDIAPVQLQPTFYSQPTKSAVNLMTQSMTASMTASMMSSGGRGRRKNDLAPNVPPNDRLSRSASAAMRKRSVSMSRLDQLALPRKPYVEAQKAGSTLSNSSGSRKDQIQSPKRPLSSASEKSTKSGRTGSAAIVSRRPQTSVRKPRPVSVAGSVPDRKPQPQTKLSAPPRRPLPQKKPVSEKSNVSGDNVSVAKSTPGKRTNVEAVKKETEDKSKSTTPRPPLKSAACRQSTPKSSPSRKLLTNKKKAAMAVAVVTVSAEAAKSAELATQSSQDEDSLSADERSSGKHIVSEEEAKAALAEKRRLAREQAERETELERLKQEELKQEEERRLQLEEEEQRKLEEEQLRMLEEHKKFEEKKLQKAIEEEEKRNEEEKNRREEDARFKAEMEKKALEEAEKQRIELEEKLRREEEERAERKKRLDKIMSRTRGKSSGTASPSGSLNGSDPPDSLENHPLSSDPSSLESNDQLQQMEQSSPSESFDVNETLMLASQSLSSNDLMLPSSEHTSIDESIHALASELTSMESQKEVVVSEDATVHGVASNVSISSQEEVTSIKDHCFDEVQSSVTAATAETTENTIVDNSLGEVQLSAIAATVEMTENTIKDNCFGEVKSSATAEATENPIVDNCFDEVQSSVTAATTETIENATKDHCFDEIQSSVTAGTIEMIETTVKDHCFGAVQSSATAATTETTETTVKDHCFGAVQSSATAATTETTETTVKDQCFVETQSSTTGATIETTATTIEDIEEPTGKSSNAYEAQGLVTQVVFQPPEEGAGRYNTQGLSHNLLESSYTDIADTHGDFAPEDIKGATCRMVDDCATGSKVKLPVVRNMPEMYSSADEILPFEITEIQQRPVKDYVLGSPDEPATGVTTTIAEIHHQEEDYFQQVEYDLINDKVDDDVAANNLINEMKNLEVGHVREVFDDNNQNVMTLMSQSVVMDEPYKTDDDLVVVDVVDENLMNKMKSLQAQSVDTVLSYDSPSTSLMSQSVIRDDPYEAADDIDVNVATKNLINEMKNVQIHSVDDVDSEAVRNQSAVLQHPEDRDRFSSNLVDETEFYSGSSSANVNIPASFMNQSTVFSDASFDASKSTKPFENFESNKLFEIIPSDDSLPNIEFQQPHCSSSSILATERNPFSDPLDNTNPFDTKNVLRDPSVPSGRVSSSSALFTSGDSVLHNPFAIEDAGHSSINDFVTTDGFGSFTHESVCDRTLKNPFAMNSVLLPGAIECIAEESEDSSLDSNLSQVLNVNTEEVAYDAGGSLPNGKLNELNVFHVEQGDLRPNGCNGNAYEDRLRSADFEADPISCTSEKRLQHVPDNGNITSQDIYNLDNTNSNKVASNPFLGSSEANPLSSNLF